VSTYAERLASGRSLSQHPVSLGVRFALELSALGSVALWGWQAGHGWMSWLLAVLLPVIGAVVWGLFATDPDVGHGSTGTVMVSGPVRLLAEAGVFLAAIAASYGSGHPALATAFAVAVVAQSSVSYDRLLLLLRGR